MTIKIWDIESGKTLNTLSGHLDIVLSVTSSIDGKLIISGSRDKTIKLWDYLTGNLLTTYFGHLSEITTIMLHVNDI